MPVFIGLIVVFFIILYKRSTEIIVVNPLKGQRQAPLPDDDAPDAAPDFAGLLGNIQQAVQAAQNPAAAQGRAAIMQMVQNNQFIEAIQLYRRLYGVDLRAAKQAVDKMMLEK